MTPNTVWPRRPKNTATGSHADPVGSTTTTSWVPSAALASAAASSAARLATVERARRRARTRPASSITTVVAGDAKVDPEQANR